MRRILIFLFILICLNSFGAGVKPLVVDIDAQPGDIREFNLTFSPGSKKEDLKLTFFKSIQIEDGGINYESGQEKNFDIMKWITLEKDKVTIYPEKETEIKCQVKIPFSAGGSETLIIMVENDVKEKKAGGIQFAVRYAVRVNIRVDRPGLDKKLNISNAVLNANEDKKPVVSVKLENSSKWDFETNIETTLRDSNRKLVERLEVKTKYQNNNNLDSQRIYPGSILNFTAPITKRLNPGKYNLRTFVKYGNKQKILNQEIEIKDGEYSFPSLEEMGYFTSSEEEVAVELKTGLRKTQKIMIQNELDKEYITAAMYKDPENKYKYSVGNMLNLRSKNGLTMRSRGKQTYLFTMEVPKDTEAGSYHGTLVLAALSEEKKVIYQKEIPVTLITGTDFKYDIEAKSLYGQIENKEQVLSLNFRNRGNIFIKPSAEIVITDKDGKFIERLNLNLPEGLEMTLPLKDGMLTGTAKSLKTGIYNAEIKFMNNGEELIEIKKELVVEA